MVCKEIAELRLLALELGHEEVEGEHWLIGAPSSRFPAVAAFVDQLAKDRKRSCGAQTNEGRPAEEAKQRSKVDRARDIARRVSCHRQVEILKRSQGVGMAIRRMREGIGQEEIVFRGISR